MSSCTLDVLKSVTRAHLNKGTMGKTCHRPSDEQRSIVTLLLHVTVVTRAICYNVPYVTLCFLRAPRWLLPAPMVVQPCEYQQLHINIFFKYIYWHAPLH